MRVRVPLVVCVLAGLVGSASAQSILLNGVASPTGVSVTAGGPVSVEVSGGPGNTTDWIGLFPTGAPDYGSLAWSYLSGTTTPPSSGLTSGTFSRPAPLAAGTYEWRLYANDTSTRIATSGTLTVTATTAALNVNGVASPTPLTVVAGTSLVVTLSNGPGNPTDWVALAPVGAPTTEVVDWRYLNNTTVAPTSGTTSATINLVAPMTPGNYEVRLFPATHTNSLVVSSAVTVTASTAAMLVNSTAPPTAVQVNAGMSVAVNVSNGPGNPGDWVGLYAVNAPDAGALVWEYLDGTTTMPATGVTGASLTFSIPNVSGSFEFRFFSSGTYVRLATSTSLVVSGTQLAVNGVAAPNSTTVYPSAQAIVSVGSGPGYVGDWVGLYAAGASDYEMLDWRYLNDTATAPSTGLTAATLHFAVPTTVGTYEFRFFIDDTYGRLATSGALQVVAAPPVVTVALTSPYAGTTFNGPASIQVTATANVIGGTVQRVDFFDGATLIGTATSAPYSISWTTPPEGAHVLTAVAIDNTSAATTSTAVGIIVAAAGSTHGTLGVPRASPAGGVYPTAPVVSLVADAGAVVYYTTDGSVPDETAPVYSGSFMVEQSSTIRARAYRTGWTESAVMSESYVLDTAGPTIVPTITPGANAAGWNNTPVTVSFECIDASAVASCPAPVTLTDDGAGQLVTVTAQDAFGRLSTLTVTVNIDSVAPAVTMSAPAADLSTTTTELSVSGSATDAGSGVERAICGGANATLTAGAASCSVVLQPGRNSVVFSAVDVAGNSASSGLTATLLTPPTSIAIGPTTVALAVGDVRGLTVTTDTGLTPTGVSWTSSDPAVLSVAPENDGTVVAESLGQSTVTATLGNLTAEAVVRVLPGGVAQGESIWTLAPRPGRVPQPPLRANPVRDDDADLFSIDSDPATSATMVRAVRAADGSVLWQQPVAERPLAADAFGGVLYRTIYVGSDTFNRSSLHRVGGGGIAPWEYHSAGHINDVVAASDGTVYMSEYIGSPSGLVPTWGNPNPRRGDTFIVILDGRTGAVRRRVPIPFGGSGRFADMVDGGVCISQTHPDGGTLGLMAVVENGDVVLQHHQQHFRHNAQGCDMTSTDRSDTLRLLRISPSGALGATTLHEYSGSWPGAGGVGVGNVNTFTGINRPDGRGGVLSTWQKVDSSQSYENEGLLSRVVDGGVTFTRAAAWALSDSASLANVMVTSQGVAYVPDGVNGELTAHATDTWAVQWTAPASGTPIQGLANGGLHWLTWDGTLDAGVVQELDSTGTVTTSATTDLYLPAVSFRDQGVIHGVGSDGTIQMVAAESSVAVEWSFEDGSFDRCTPPNLIADVWPNQANRSIGFPRRTAAYTFALLDDEQDPRPNARWRSKIEDGISDDFQKNGVREAFVMWQGSVEALQYEFVESSATDVNLPIQKGNLVDLFQEPASTVGFFRTYDADVVNRRAERGEIWLSSNEDWLFGREGYLRAAIHELGHVLGLTHPWAPANPIPSSFPIRRGGTVMNNFFNPPPRPGETRPPGAFRDDFSGRGNVPLRPTICDAYGVVDAAYRQ